MQAAVRAGRVGLLRNLACAQKGFDTLGLGLSGGVVNIEHYGTRGSEDACSTSGREMDQTTAHAGARSCSKLAQSAFGAVQAKHFSSHAEVAPIPPEFDLRPGPIAAYHKLVEGGIMKDDDHQEAALVLLQNLYEELVHMVDQRPEGKNYGSESRENWWSRLVGLSHRSGAIPVRGLYLYGGVGTGKTMLMDMFYKELPDSIAKTRIHFHDFMLDIHGRLQKLRSLPDPLEAVATQVTGDTKLLCLDEFMVTDVADAMILNRLFQHLFSKGLVLVSTSNRGPDRLYEGGLQRQLFLPFIETLKQRCVVHEIGSSTDYRRLTEAQLGLFFYGQGASEMLEAKFRLITENAPTTSASVEVAMGRKISVLKAAGARAFFEFHELCEMPLGAADYIALCNYFHTLAIDDVPTFGASNRSAAYRFATLVDVMYEHKTRLLCSAEATPVELFDRVVTYADRPQRSSSRSWEDERADLLVDNELGFAKDRIVSRLTEMQSLEYLEDWSQRHFHTDTHEDSEENRAAQGGA